MFIWIQKDLDENLVATKWGTTLLRMKKEWKLGGHPQNHNVYTNLERFGWQPMATKWTWPF
jgi:hypothetical protein